MSSIIDFILLKNVIIFYKITQLIDIHYIAQLCIGDIRMLCATLKTAQSIAFLN